MSGLARVSWRRLVSLKCAGWVPQDGVSSEGGPLSIHERGPEGGVAHSIRAGHRQRARRSRHRPQLLNVVGVALLLEHGQ